MLPLCNKTKEQPVPNDAVEHGFRNDLFKKKKEKRFLAVFTHKEGDLQF